MAQTGHRSVEMVRRYIRAGSLFQENAAAHVGLGLVADEASQRGHLPVSQSFDA